MSEETLRMAGRGSNGDTDDTLVEGFLVSISGRAWGIALGTLLGLGLFLVTNVLVLRGGEDMGTHLGLLGQYLPFYRVSFLGSLIGFAYAFVIGYVTGRVICFVYNRIAGGASD